MTTTPTKPSAERLTVPQSVVDSLRAHAQATPAGMEFGGRLLVRAGAVESFEATANLSTEPGRFSSADFPAPPAGCREIRLHSHPSPVFHPSDADVEVALLRGQRQTAIYSVPLRSLAVWAVAEDRSYEAVPITHERRSSRRVPPRRPGRRW